MNINDEEGASQASPRALKGSRGDSTKRSPSQMFGSRWVLTQHGASPESLSKLSSFFETDQISSACVAYETGVYGIHPHWQCYFQTAKQCRMKNKIAEVLGHNQFHLELARGTKQSNVSYLFAVRKEHELGWIHYRKNVETPSQYLPAKTENLLSLHRRIQSDPQLWQRTLRDTFIKPADFRKILWVYEPKGNTGKSYFVKYMHYFHGAIVTGGKSGDMKFAIARWKEITGAYPVILFIDLARSDDITEQGYRTIEEMKNAVFFSGKYESGMVASLSPPHFCVFANAPPKREFMSKDRWTVYRLDEQSERLILEE